MSFYVTLNKLYSYLGPILEPILKSIIKRMLYYIIAYDYKQQGFCDFSFHTCQNRCMEKLKYLNYCHTSLLLCTRVSKLSLKVIFPNFSVRHRSHCMYRTSEVVECPVVL